MESLNGLITAVKQFRGHNASRESRRFNKFIDLGGLDKAIQTLNQTAENESSDTEHILASIKQLNESLTTFGQSSGRGDMREESGDLHQLIRYAENIRKAATSLLMDLGTLASPRELGKTLGILTRIIQFLRRRMNAVGGLENFRF